MLFQIANKTVSPVNFKQYYLAELNSNPFFDLIFLFMKYLITLLLLAFTAATHAQSDYIVTAKGDTLRGKIKILVYDKLDRVQLTTAEKRKIYTALEARTVSLKNEIYHTVNSESGIVYMKLMKGGFVSLYGFRLPGQLNYDGRFLVKKNGTSLELPNLAFRKAMAEFLNECEDIKVKIKNGDLQKKDIETIIDQYNVCVTQSTEQKTIANTNETITNEKSLTIQALMEKVEHSEDFASKKDALDLLKDIKGKAVKNETIPNYLTEGLKSYLGSIPAFSADLEKVLALIKN